MTTWPDPDERTFENFVFFFLQIIVLHSIACAIFIPLWLILGFLHILTYDSVLGAFIGYATISGLIYFFRRDQIKLWLYRKKYGPEYTFPVKDEQEEDTHPQATEEPAPHVDVDAILREARKANERN